MSEKNNKKKNSALEVQLAVKGCWTEEDLIGNLALDL